MKRRDFEAGLMGMQVVCCVGFAVAGNPLLALLAAGFAALHLHYLLNNE